MICICNHNNETNFVIQISILKTQSKQNCPTKDLQIQLNHVCFGTVNISSKEIELDDQTDRKRVDFLEFYCAIEEAMNKRVMYENLCNI